MSTTFTTRDGFVKWAEAHDLPITWAPDGLAGTIECPFGILACSFADAVVANRYNGRKSGDMIDAYLHAEHMSHGWGSNTMPVLLRMAMTGRPV